jgi:hypothetical protein
MMLFYYLYYAKYVCIGALVVSLLVALCAGYAYSINAQRAEDDPEKRNYSPGAFILVFFTWPILLPLLISLFLLRVLLYGVFIMLFIVFLFIIPRESPKATWLEMKMAKIGDALLRANAFLIKLMVRPWTEEPETI